MAAYAIPRMLSENPEEDGWEKTDFPVVCEDCLGPNPYVRMMKQDYGGECAISGRPFTVFRWQPGAEARYKKTVVCKEVALARNVCQVCLLDLEYGVPVQVRDAVLASGGGEDNRCVVIPESDANKEYVTEQIARKAEEQGHAAVAILGGGGSGGKISNEKAEMLRKMSRRNGPYYRRNKPKICSFWMKGACTRSDCPFRPCNGDYDMPELSSSHSLRNQNMKDRYYGVNDPVAEQMLNRMKDNGRNISNKLVPPEDRSITTIFIGGVVDTNFVNEQSLNEAMYSFGEIKSIKIIPAKKCAFVTFVERSSAERCMSSCGVTGIIISGKDGMNSNLKLNLSWGKPAAPKNSQQSLQQKPNLQQDHQQGLVQPPMMHTSYPSMDPNAMGTINK